MTDFSKKSPRLLVLNILSLIGLGLLAWLTQHFYEVRGGTAAFKSFCDVGRSMNCDAVAASPYAEIFPGVPLSALGAGWFLAIFFISLIAHQPFWRRDSVRAIFGLTGISALAGLSYFLVMALVLKTFCILCLVTDAIALVSLGLAWSLKPEGFKKHPWDRSKAKSLALVWLASVVIGVIGLRAFDTGASSFSTAEANEKADEVLASPVLAVNNGPQFPSMGTPGAPVTIVEFSDFQCPYCRFGALTLNSVLNRYPGKVRVVFRNYPLDPSCNPRGGMHTVSCEAARAGLCSQRQGVFVPVYEEFFQNQAELTKKHPVEMAVEAGAKRETLTTCMQSGAISDAITRDLDEGDRLGVESTPTFFINGHRLNGAYPLPVWTRIIDKLLAK